MSWNYRIVYHKAPNREWYGLHEAYYAADGTVSMVAVKAEVVGESPDEIRESLRMMLADACKDRPILEIGADGKISAREAREAKDSQASAADH